MRIEGYGGRPRVDAYRFQGLDLTTPSYLTWPSLALKFIGQETPCGTQVADLARNGGELLVAPCGECQVPVAKCRCSFRAASE